MKQRIKLNNKKSHFPLPLGEGRISTQGTSVRNSGEGKSFTKALSVAALAGLTFFGASASAQGVNTEDNSSLTFEEGQITGAAADITPTLGENAVYELVDSSSDSNTAMSIKLEDGSTKYVNIKKTSYTLHDGNSGDITYSWNSSTRKMSVSSPHNSSQRYAMSILDGDYVRANGGTGGAVYSAGINYDEINANFIGTQANYGTLHIADGKVNTMNANYIGNNVNYSGGGLYLKGNSIVKELTGDFIGNCAGSGSTNHGGGIFILSGDIQSLKGDFISNSGGLGGAIKAYSMTGDITGNFINNKAVYGGGALQGNFSGNIKGNFIGNYVYRPSATSYGGAIYSESDLNIIANDGYTSRFIGNYVEDKDGKRSESIYMANADSVLNFTQGTGGNFVLGDAIDGTDGYKVNITGDNTGTVYLYDSIKNAVVDITGVDMNTADGKAFNYNFKTLNFDPEIKWTTELDLANSSADKFTIQNTTTDTMYLDKLNILNPQDNLDKEFIVQILDVPENTMQLELSASLKNDLNAKEYLVSSVTKNTQDEVTQHTNWKDEFHSYSQTTDTYGKLNLATTNTTNDSIGIYVSRVDEQDIVDHGKLGDTLAMVNQSNIDERTFDFDTASDVYKVTENLGTTGTGKFTINGVTGEDGSKSVIDFQGHSGMNVTNASDVTVKDVELVNAGFIRNEGSVMYVNNANAKVNLENIYAHDNNNTSTDSYGLYGGVIYNNKGEITNISGLFENNTISAKDKAYGSAIHNNSNIGKIHADFINNSSISSYVSEGIIGAIGAIENDGTVDEISGLFKGNRAINTANGSAYAGVLFNGNGKIGKISGKFENNYAEANASFSENKFGTTAGAIENRGVIDDIKADFTGNYTKNSGEQSATAGAVHNSDTGIITTLEGDFKQNYAYSTEGIASGGAIYNQGEISSLKGDFSENYAQSTGTNANGGAIYNSNTINGINGNLAGNYIESSGAGAAGGAIYNNRSGAIHDINGNLTDNYAKSSGTYAIAGAVYNYGNINNITGDYKTNSAQSSGTYAVGGALYNSASINDIIGEYSGNYAKTSGTFAMGGAIYNDGTINDIKGNYSNNYVQAGSTYAAGGAISNYGAINDIIGNYSSNNAKSTGTYARGGAIYNNGTINNIKGDYIGNYAKTSGTYALGGAISNYKTIGNIIGNFKNNSSQSSGTNASAGAIYNSSTIEKIKGDFTNNSAVSTKDEALAGAIRNQSGSIGTIEGNFTGNTVSAALTGSGGALWNAAKIGDIKSNFINNSVKTSSNEELAFGGAVYSNRADMQFSADGKQSVFSGNYTQDKRGKINNAIFVRTNKQSAPDAEEEFFAPNITLNAKNGGSFLFNDNIDGGEINYEWTELKRNHQYTLKLKGDSTGKVYFNNDILNANIEHNDVTTFVDGMKSLNHAKGEGINSLAMNSGTLNVGSFNLAPLHFEKFSMNGGTINIDKVDVDLANKTMGRITANSYGGSDKGTINVNAMNVLSDGEKEVTPVLFADKSFKNTVKSPVKEAYTKLYRYDVSYDTNGKFGEDGYFVFTRGAGSSNPSDGFNPAVLTDSTAVQAGGQTAMNQVIKFAFEHADVFSQLPSVDRFAKINSNKYAIASTDYNSNLKYNGDLNNQGVWVKPYSTFENIKLKNGPKVNTINYGTLIGFDSDFHKLKHGWANVGTAYIGYSGSQMDYKGVDASMNSGLIGLTETFYKGNFWTALTATAGAGVAEAHTMYGKDDITMLMAGVGSKTGYNLEFKEGKFIIQPRLFMSYSFVNSFDYTNSAGVRIDSDPMHTVQINPSIRFIGNTKGGWQPYASVGMVWNLLNETNATADGVKLPEMHTKPYVEYGVGLQRTWADKFSAYGQAMLRHGGRNGVALTFGFRWAIGKGVNDKQKVQKDSKMLGRQEVKRASKTLSHQNEPAAEGNRKVLKQLSPTQKQKLANTTTIGNNIYPQKARLQGTTRTTMNANVEKL